MSAHYFRFPFIRDADFQRILRDFKKTGASCQTSVNVLFGDQISAEIEVRLSSAQDAELYMGLIAWPRDAADAEFIPDDENFLTFRLAA